MNSEVGGSVTVNTFIAESGPARDFSLHQLPASPSDFIGRLQELARLRQVVESLGVDGAITIGIEGMGGVGKTAFALRLAEEIRPFFPDAQFFVDLKGATEQGAADAPLDANQAICHVIRGLIGRGAELPSELGELQSLMRGIVAEFVKNGRRVMFVWDNARNAAQVHDIPLIPGTISIFTSRRTMAFPGMVVQHLDRLSTEDGVSVLRSTSGAARKDLSNEQAAQVCEICGGLPHALRLVGGVLACRPDLPADSVLSSLTHAENQLSAIDEFRHDSGARSLQASLANSETMLPEELRAKWHMLAVFSGSFNYLGAGAVWGLDLHQPESKGTIIFALSKLRAFNVVDVDAETGRYRLHDLTRSFLLDRLVNENDVSTRRELWKRYVQFGQAVVLLAEQARTGTGGLPTALLIMDFERQNIIQAFMVAETLMNEYEWARRAVIALVTQSLECLSRRVPGKQMVEWLTVALEAARRDDMLASVAPCLANLGLAMSRLGEWKQALPLFEESISVSRKHADKAAECRGLVHLARAHIALNDVKAGIECLEGGLAISRELGKAEEAAVLQALAAARMSGGDPQQALETIRAGEEAARLAQDTVRQSSLVGDKSLILLELGYTEEAQRCHQEFLEAVRNTEDPMLEGEAHAIYGSSLLRTGDARGAENSWTRYLNIARSVGDLRAECHALAGIGEAKLIRGDEECVTALQESARIARDIGGRFDEARVLVLLACAENDRGNIAAAEEHLQAALQLSESLEDVRGIALATSKLAIIAINRGEVEGSIRQLEEAVQAVRRVGDQLAIGRILGHLAIAYAIVNKKVEAVEALYEHINIAKAVGDKAGACGSGWNLGQLLIEQGQVIEGLRLMQQQADHLLEIGHPNASECQSRINTIKRDLTSVHSDIVSTMWDMP